MWVRAIEVYSQVYKAVDPKRNRVREASSLLEASKAKLLEKTLKLQGIEDQLHELKKSYETSLAEKVKTAPLHPFEIVQRTRFRKDEVVRFLPLLPVFPYCRSKN